MLESLSAFGSSSRATSDSAEGGEMTSVARIHAMEEERDVCSFSTESPYVLRVARRTGLLLYLVQG